MRIVVSLLRFVPERFLGGRTFLAGALGGLSALAGSEEIILVGGEEARTWCESLVPQMEFAKCGRAGRSVAQQVWHERRHIDDFARRRNADVVFFPFNIMATCGTPTVLMLHDLVAQYYIRHLPKHAGVLTHLRAWVISQSITKASLIAVPSQAIAEELYQERPGLQARVRVVPEAVPDHLWGLPIVRNAKDDGLIILQSAGYAPHKDVETGINALSSLRRRGSKVYSSCSLLITGCDTGFGERIGALARRLGVADRVKCVGQVSAEEMLRLQQSADIACIPSTYEGFGLPIVEAQALGTPVVASDIPVLREVTKGAALFFTPRDPEMLADRIESLAADPGLRARLGQAGYVACHQRTWRDFASELVDVCYEAAGRSRLRTRATPTERDPEDQPIPTSGKTYVRRSNVPIQPNLRDHSTRTINEEVELLFRSVILNSSASRACVENPLGDLILPGETVFLKPNLVKETHPRDPEGWRYVLTDAAVIDAVAALVCRAVGPQGRVIVGDAPQTDSSFSAIAQLLGLYEMRDRYRAQGYQFDVIDLRQEEWTARDNVIVDRRKLPGDPAGYVAFDLGAASEFQGHRGSGQYYGADYDSATLNFHHSGGRHEYLISGTAIQADVVFSLPKLKTHKKAGITASLKNLVGINGDKNWLPHHTEGPISRGGDERPEASFKEKMERAAVRQLKRLAQEVPGLGPQLLRLARNAGSGVFGDTETVIRSGNWWGNDTTWRMCLDLNKILAYGNPDGTLRPPGAQSRKRHYVLVDALLAGEGSGPMNPDPVEAGLLIFGTHAPSVDAVCAWVMGFDPGLIPIVRQAFRCADYPLSEWDWPDVTVTSDHEAWNGRLGDMMDRSTLKFRPHFGWEGHIERKAVPTAVEER